MKPWKYTFEKVRNNVERLRDTFSELKDCLMEHGVTENDYKLLIETKTKEDMLDISFDWEILVEKLHIATKKKHKIKDLTGQKFGKLTVINRIENSPNRINWLCECECGGERKFVSVAGNNLTSGRQKSCGCLKKGNSGAKFNPDSFVRKNKRLYTIYYAMRSRCSSEKSKSYKDYGGRGITVCEEWRNEINGLNKFIEWSTNNGYSKELSIDRVDVNGNYEPANCRWATNKVQSNNKRNTPLLEVNGIIKTHDEWEKENNLPKNIIRQRLKSGWDKTDLFKESQGKLKEDSELKGITYNKGSNKWNLHVKGEFIGAYLDLDEAKIEKFRELNK